MNSNPEPISQGFAAAESDARHLRRTVRRCLLAVTPLLLAGSLIAEDRPPADGAPRGERAANPGAPRGERPAGPERTPGPNGRRAEFPEELKLTDDQQAKIREINTEISASDAEMAKKRETILTAEQKSAQEEVMKKLREGGLSRQEAGEQIAAALKLTADQKKEIEELDAARRSLAQEANTRKMAVLSEEQRATMRKLTTAANVARVFSIPGPPEASDAQKASLKALQEEFGPRLIDLTEKRAVLLTDERRVALDAAFKEARASGKDRQQTTDAVNAALKMTDAERAQLTETEQGLRDLQEQIREKVMALLTAEQKAEFEKRAGARR